jgi:hypothetical protein
MKFVISILGSVFLMKLLAGGSIVRILASIKTKSIELQGTYFESLWTPTVVILFSLLLA